MKAGLDELELWCTQEKMVLFITCEFHLGLLIIDCHYSGTFSVFLINFTICHHAVCRVSFG